MLTAHSQGVLLHVKAQPGSRREGITGVHDGRLKVAVHAAPEKGKANAALIDVLAEELGLRRQQIQLMQGETSGQKTFLLTGVTQDELQARLNGLLHEG
ncbi:MAG TPA: DUF167 domain-containing protein [Gemmatales bacterium]|nr:DUF167 domain-containing protein [Gemmatales bacterium]